MAKILAAMGILGAFVVIAGAVLYLYKQGVPAADWQHFSGAKVSFDAHGVPTLEQGDWLALVETQAYVVASERLWQMDLLRRKASGRLSAWFGSKAVAHDTAKQQEGRLEVAAQAVTHLPADQRQQCERYAQGVNRFIADYPYRWGVEYGLLRTKPEAWQCRDSMLILLEMMQQLTATAEMEAQQELWKRHLPASWANFLFPQDHPWNAPYFGTPAPQGPPLPPAITWLPPQPLQPEEQHAAVAYQEVILGSNNWAYRGERGHFLANDPHLQLGVPGVWYAMRLRAAADDWAVGVTIPGVPGLILGMNTHLAWSFTNTGEDVDDLVAEHMSADGESYEDWDAQGHSIWRPVQRKAYSFQVKGEAEPRTGEARFTVRGPLSTWPSLGAGEYSRQWLGLRPDTLALPTLGLMRAQNLTALDKALDGFTAPAQNIVMLDRAGNMSYRTSGTGIQRRHSGLRPLPAKEGRWLGLEPSAKRRRLRMDRDPLAKHRFIATANERVWVDTYGAHWSSDDRKARITSLLQGRSDLGVEQMEQMQRDTTSRFRKLLLSWLVKHSGIPNPQWQAWDGSGRNDAVSFRQAGAAERLLVSLLLARVKKQYFADREGEGEMVYSGRLARAWLTKTIGDDTVLAAFGLNHREVASFIVTKLKEAGPPKESQRMRAQHPFVGSLPILGLLFKVAEPIQYGGVDTIAAESATAGPSVRLVWDLSNPSRSSWIWPVGQSGHVASPFYRSAQQRWHEGRPFAVFPDKDSWQF